jgi:hypothetical protein
VADAITASANAAAGRKGFIRSVWGRSARRDTSAPDQRIRSIIRLAGF